MGLLILEPSNMIQRHVEIELHFITWNWSHGIGRDFRIS
jgi:hypothetical protein